jgi:hypothetical protein
MEIITRAIGKGCSEIAVRLGTPETLNREREPLLGMVGNGQHPPSQIVIFRPQVQQRLIAIAAHFPRERGQWRDARSVLAQFRRASRCELAKRSFQLGR